MRQAAVDSRQATRIPGWRRGVVIAACLVFAGGLAIGATELAGAAPAPTVSQVEAQVNADQSKLDKAQQQYDKDNIQLTAAKARLAQIDSAAAADNKRFLAARKQVVQIAAAGYMDSDQTSLAGLLTNSDPGTVLSEASIITELTGARNLQTQQFLADAQQLTSVRQEQARTEAGIQQVTNQAKSAKDSALAAYKHQKSILDGLTAEQQAQVTADTVGGSHSSAVAHPVDTVPVGSGGGRSGGVRHPEGARSAARTSTGAPGRANGDWLDCSGLVQAAWAAAGVTIARDTYSQGASLPHIPLSDIAPGDLIFYNGFGHVAMYVGGGMIVDAPRSGLDVEEIPMSTSWYANSVSGVARVSERT